MAEFVIVLLFLSVATPSARGQAPAPKTIAAVLTKAGKFTKFLQLLQSTQEAEQINHQINSKTTTGGLTVVAPTDNTFSSLPSGALNSLSDQQKTSLVQFHVLSMLLPHGAVRHRQQPAADAGRRHRQGKYPLNVTAEGTRLNISTGVVNATVDNTLYSGDKLVVYEVNKVLLLWALHGPPVPAPAPAPADKAKKKAGPAVVADAPATDTAAGTTASEAAARGVRGFGGGLFGVAVAVAIAWCGM